MGCQAVKNKEVRVKGEPSIEKYTSSGKPVYYCYGYIDRSTYCLIETCSNCKKNVMYA